MLVLGMMSGTSADGIDVALARISGQPPKLSIKLEGHHHLPYASLVRKAILRVAAGESYGVAEISQLNFALGEEFALAAIAACKAWRVPLRRISLIGSHGQTIYHQGVASSFLGHSRISSTLQIAEPSVIAERTGVTTIADFRPADMAAGGQGAPLVPFVDYVLYRHPKRNRVALNIGGIANVTVIPAGVKPKDVFAFDTGPGNMIVDALVEKFTHGRAGYDKDSEMALRGSMLPKLLNEMMEHPYLHKEPPKTAGREQFGRAYAEKIFAWGKNSRAKPADVVRTATIFTSLSIANAFQKFILPRAQVDELIVSGGGARNTLMMVYLAAILPGFSIVSSDHFGVQPEAKEALAFAVLAYESFYGRSNNLPFATGARHHAILGKLVHGRAR
ncbi:MAG TPA: anhydro-N-acetylmuramic acid kinase [Candidatus Binatus sp.]|jgi:anhydro-N-acetylmuramic acid kinase|nr:anhydro-N-acetylmuramic acid kinase [Candidatus Binatus sp.]